MCAPECQASAETPVRHQPKLCKASAEHVLSCLSRIRAESGADGRIRTGDPLFTNQHLSRPPGVRLVSTGAVLYSAAANLLPINIDKCHLVVTSLVVFWWYGALVIASPL